MKRIFRIIHCCQFILVLHFFCPAQVIPSERQVDWSVALNSYSYNTPTKELNVKDYGAVGDGITNDQPAVMSAISALNGRLGSVYFPEGNYLMNNPISLTDSVILNGAGANVCELIFDLNHSNKNCITIDKPQISETITLNSGYNKESTKLITDSSFMFNEGEYALIFQENGEWDDKPINWANNAVGQIVQIMQIDGDTLYLKNPLRITYEDELNPKVKSIKPIFNSGVQCLKIKRANEPESAGGANIFMRYAVNCFIRGVESDTSIGSHIDIFSSSNILVDGCYIHHAFSYDGASKHGYGITMNNQTGECLITNNIFEHLRHAMMVKTGSNGNVFAYNYSRDVYRSEWPNNYGGDISLHGHFAYANLFESNIVQNIIIDHYWGPSGPFNTFFRNRAESFGIIITDGDPTTSDMQNYVGNEITNTGFFYGNYMLTGSDHFQFGNNVLENIIPAGTNTLNDSSYYLEVQPVFWKYADNWPSIGLPNELGIGSIPAKDRHDSGSELTVCPDSIVTFLHENNNDTGYFNLWPNPAENLINISWEEANKYLTKIALITTSGQLIYKIETDKNQISLNLDMLPNSGIYFIQIRSEKWIYMKKLLVFK